jgi:hypothetical protein
MLTSVDDLGYGLGVALAGSQRDRVAMSAAIISAFAAVSSRARGAGRARLS